jgi:hypothetical protein
LVLLCLYGGCTQLNRYLSANLEGCSCFLGAHALGKPMWDKSLVTWGSEQGTHFLLNLISFQMGVQSQTGDSEIKWQGLHLAIVSNCKLVCPPVAFPSIFCVSGYEGSHCYLHIAGRCRCHMRSACETPYPILS